MYQLTPVQMNSLCAPHVMLQIFTQLQILQTESNTIWKHCNVTIVDLNKQVNKSQRERKRWRHMEQELLDEKDTLQQKFLNALEKNTELEGFLQQQKEHKDLILTETKNLRESLQKVQKELETALGELKKYKEIAKNKEEEATKASKDMEEMVQELSVCKEQSKLCNILADTAIGSEGSETPTNSTVHKLSQATEAVKGLINYKNEMQNTSSNLEAAVNERDQLKKVLQERDLTLSKMTEEKTSMSEEINTNRNNITSLSEEKQQLQRQLQEEIAKNSKLQQDAVEEKKLCGSFKEAQDILKRCPQNLALLREAIGGNVREIEVLLNAGAYIEATDELKRTPLILAAKSGNTEACKLLLERGANLEARAIGLGNNTPFLAAVLYSHNLDTVKFLANAGANKFAKDIYCQTAFQKTAINERIKQWLKNMTG